MRAVRLSKILCGSSTTIFDMCCLTTSSTKLQVRHSASLCGSNFKLISLVAVQIRNLGLGPTSKDFEEPTQITGPMTKVHATELLLRLTDDERIMLHKALEEFESNRIKEEFEEKLAGQRWRKKLAGQRWRSKIGRPSKGPTLGDVDPTGTYCPVPEDWLKKKYAATVPRPSTKELFHLSLANSIPFIGFGFLDNFIMILAGERIESGMSAYITLSTMGAAALGNTLSDVIGIGSSYYVERAAMLVGLGAPALSPVQIDMPVSRRFANARAAMLVGLGAPALSPVQIDMPVSRRFANARAAMLVGLGAPALSPVQIDMPVSRRFANARAAMLVGLGAPALSPVQIDMPVSRRFANAGRVLGITLGCFLGMTPLLFRDDEKKPEAKPQPTP
ncbi:Transmembrane protein 65 [Operophtera brumata]|uniref:Transmembrane protein 65 n=1 Tax=Operophtera brumata TaxID=104452 RepID=A0A0L7K4M9_OPEBR|nr:Transmembrane protein 65 [Operophtera brumata]